MRVAIIVKSSNCINHMVSHNLLQGIKVWISGSKAINKHYNHNLPAHINPPIMANSSDNMVPTSTKNLTVTIFET